MVALQGANEIGVEDERILVAALQREPSHSLPRRAKQVRVLRQESRLSVTGRGVDEGEAMPFRAREPLEKPFTGLSAVMRMPIVRMIRQPPVAVPRPMLTAHATFTHVSIRNSPVFPWNAYTASAITPIVFWPSLPPWLNAMYMLDRI